MKVSKHLPALIPALAAVALAVQAAPAWGASVKQVRVGDHAEFTRIVVELDGPAAYSVRQKSVGGVAELVLGLDATTSTRVVSSRSDLVENVQLRPTPNGAEAHITLRAGAVSVKEMVLKGPDRIVLDVSPAPAAQASPAPAPAPTRAATPRPTAAAPTPMRTAAAPTPATPSEPSAAAEEDEAEATPTPSAREAEQSVAAAGEDAAEESEREPPAAGERPNAMAAAHAAKARSDVSAKKAEPEPASATAPSLVDRLVGGDPGLGLTVALGGVALLLAAFLLLRRRSQRVAQEAASAPWPPPGAEERPEYAAASGEQEDEEEREPLVSLNDDDAPLFAATERDDGDDDAVSLPTAPVDAEPEVVAKADSPEVEELERRIERLEARLADSLDARERLERQLAAHTEELRVQRAAIARTQRAVRAAVRGPEAADQPAAQRVPSQVPSPSADPKPDEGEA